MPSRLSSLPWARLRSNSRPFPTQPIVILDEKDGFGIPAFGDPDPFGVLALEREGLEIKEAGTKHRPSSDAFEYRPSPTSPIFSTFARRSVDGISRRSSRRESKYSVMSLDQATQTADLPPPIDQILRSSSDGIAKKQTEELATLDEDGDDEMEQETLVGDDEMEGGEEEVDVIIEEASAAVHIASQTPTSPVVSRARLVTIPKRIPPALPPRSPYRKTLSKVMTPELVSDSASIETSDQDMSSRNSSPLRNEFFGEYASEGGNPWEEPTSPRHVVVEEVSIPPEECRREEEKAVNENDEFHSLPSSPIEASAPVI